VGRGEAPTSRRPCRLREGDRHHHPGRRDRVEPETVLKTRIEGGAPPDLAFLAQPTPILTYAAQARSSISLPSWIGGREEGQDEHGNTISLVTKDEKIWGIPYKADVKSSIWYPIKAFEAAATRSRRRGTS
jgi:ABC-type glycerol-3-phosphate transport system substrate-binding protein